MKLISVKVTEAYTAQYSDPIQLEQGDVVGVAHSDPEYPEWFWCSAPSGKEGWVHRSFLAGTSETTSATAAYTAKELTVAGGETGTLHRVLDGWAYIRLADGDEGGIPQDHVKITDAAPDDTAN